MRKWTNVAIVLLIITGLSVMLYPTISSWYNSKYQINAIVDYDDSLSLLSEEYQEEQRQEAVKYNNQLNGAGIEDPFIEGSGMVLPENYASILDINDGIMGYISIPQIDVQLPVYHGTSDDVLKKGVGHMEMTAFPIGGEGNHSVLTGHTGVPDATLFTDLKDLVIGDKFYISILEETLAYEVDQIVVVEPTKTSDLLPVQGEDYLTLVTCTPYGINSHRLLVRGTRVPYVEVEEAQAVEIGLDSSRDLLPYVIIIIAVLLVIIIVIIIRRKRRRRGQYEK